MSQQRDGFFLGGIGSDVFGEQNAARNTFYDPTNDFLRDKYLKEYINWHRANHRFYDNFESDLTRQKLMRFQTWAFTLGGVAFAAMVINPNFTQRRSYYMRKIVPFMVGAVCYQYGYRCENIHMTNMLLQMNEYLPLEVRRTM